MNRGAGKHSVRSVRIFKGPVCRIQLHLVVKLRIPATVAQRAQKTHAKTKGHYKFIKGQKGESK